MVLFLDADGRTLAGAAASFVGLVVVFIAFFWNRCPSPCRLLLASLEGETASRARERFVNSSERGKRDSGERAEGDPLARFSPSLLTIGWVSDQ